MLAKLGRVIRFVFGIEIGADTYNRGFIQMIKLSTILSIIFWQCILSAVFFAGGGYSSDIAWLLLSAHFVVFAANIIFCIEFDGVKNESAKR